MTRDTPFLLRLAVGFVCLSGLAGIALLAREERPAADQMTEAADQFLASLSPELRQKAEFGFDDPHRTGWFFTPQQDRDKKPTRKGLRFEELNKEQREKALALLKTGTSAKGYEQATTIMSLEEILRDVEKKGTMVRNPNWYFVSVFGKPSKTGKWGWRIEGHHLSVNFTLDRGQVESPTPFLFGANPANVKTGPRAGLRTLPEVEDRAKELIESLDGEQKALALRDKPFPEIAENTPAAKIGAPVGIPGSKLSEKQRDILLKLIEAYTNRMPNAVGAAELKAAKDTGLDKVYFAYSGSPEPGKGYTYQVQGPTFVVQFLNMQADGSGNPANHIHSVWRRLPSDFGLEVR
ncbi:MAG: DUF3500 domain-containing protein [Zavarzinella sp.]|nr:DUF3500 domain-containing protein [Zavarzinella sp.]